MTQTAATAPAFDILYATLQVSTYSARNQFHKTTVYGEADAHELARKISIRHGHASVHQGIDVLFSYADGELMTDNRRGSQ
jgi:hypothetical protein